MSYPENKKHSQIKTFSLLKVKKHRDSKSPMPSKKITEFFKQSKISNPERFRKYDISKKTKYILKGMKCFNKEDDGNSDDNSEDFLRLKPKFLDGKNFNFEKIRNDVFDPARQAAIDRVKSLVNNESLKDKYSHLLLDQRELALPSAYKLLIEKMHALDLSLIRLKKSNPQNQFSIGDINMNIESSSIHSSQAILTKHKLKLKDFKQILFVAPHFYIYKKKSIIQSKSNQDDQILIDIPATMEQLLNKKFNSYNFSHFKSMQHNFNPITHENLENILLERKRLFTQIILFLVQSEHEKFLRSRNIEIKYNPLQEKIWHSSFEVESCSEIPEFPNFSLDSQPQQKHIKKF